LVPDKYPNKQKAWVYIDAGDPSWLSEEKHLEHATKTLLRVQVHVVKVFAWYFWQKIFYGETFWPNFFRQK